jgi:hypothetical protein
VSSTARVLAKLTQEQIKASQEHHLSWNYVFLVEPIFFTRIIRPHILNIIPRIFIYSGIESSGGIFVSWGFIGLYLQLKYDVNLENQYYLTILPGRFRSTLLITIELNQICWKSNISQTIMSGKFLFDYVRPFESVWSYLILVLFYKLLTFFTSFCAFPPFS